MTVTVTQPSGEKAEGRLVRIDHFIVTLAAEDGTLPVGHGDGRYRGVYRRTHFDGEHWHYEGYGISPRMSCKPS